MAQEIINTGAAANDGTGEALRQAFDAVNNNFTQIWSSGPVNTNVVISGNTITVTGTNNNLVLAGNGIGNIQANSSMVPAVAGAYDLGTPGTPWGDVYGTYFYGNGAFLTGISGGGGGNGTAIVNGSSNVNIATANGNVTIGIAGTGNVVSVSSNAMVVNGVIATPRVLTGNLTVPANVSAMMVSPLTIPSGMNISVPGSSVFHVIP